MTEITFKHFQYQGKEITSLQQQIKECRMVHAILITGESGTGKRTLAGLISAALVCESDEEKPCGQCNSCGLAFAGEHPDITLIEKGVPISPGVAKGKSTIPVDDIREMIRLCSQYTYAGGNRVVMIPDAENMTVQAQNCLLKILEEPPQNTYFIMTAGHPDLLLTTVRSRCRTLKLVPWEKSYIQGILERNGTDKGKAEKASAASQGSIGRAKQLASDDIYWKTREEIINSFFCNRKRSEILSFSTKWKELKTEADTLFSILEDEVDTLLRYRLFGMSAEIIKELPPEWLKFAEEAQIERFAFLTDSIHEARKQNSFNVNFQAIIEQLLLTFTGESDLWVK